MGGDDDKIPLALVMTIGTSTQEAEGRWFPILGIKGLGSEMGGRMWCLCMSEREE